ncbi:mandelate racemase/muconate lactonizing enzyme family protein [Amycolatopsis jejuensis]|uniref:mandelate racemase/muconate lactonizing enzyme family protein n=1 Tax=Amycolatopsis jejuensis TaxID=330084 RepID=UPI0005274DD8|nr:enolase C-terminal domain-like protein [Amycolatopsis jejuensis]
MKITDLTVHLVRLPARREHNWASKMTTPIGHHAIVELSTDEGITGWGEAPAGATWGGAHGKYYGETPETVAHLVTDHLRPAITGMDPLEIGVVHALMDKAVKGNPYAKAAVDIACYDAAGKALGVSASDLLGGRHRGGIEVAHSLGIMELDRCIEEAREAVAEGARTIKCKTGLDPERDVALVRMLREELGPDVRIRVDGNEGYASVAEAVAVTRRQEEFDLLLCEQPLAGAVALSRVAKRITSPVMADESAWTVHDILELDRLDAAASFSCYVTKPGGLYRARQQAEVAEQLGMICDIGGSIETGIGNAANLHLGAALRIATLPSVCPVSQPAGSGGPAIAGVYYTDDLITEPFGFADGQVLVPDGPGLGITVDRDKIEQYRTGR